MPQLSGQLPGRGARALSHGEGEGTLVSALWGHNPLPAPFLPGELPGPGCYYRRTGCVETWLSGPGFAADARRHGVQASNAAEVVAAFRRGDTAAAAAFDCYLQRLARSLPGVVNILNLDAIVLGGGRSNVGGISQRLPALLCKHVFSDAIVTPVLQAVHGDSSGVRGASVARSAEFLSLGSEAKGTNGRLEPRLWVRVSWFNDLVHCSFCWQR